MASSRRRCAAGFSLIEALVAIVVLAFGLLGAVGMLMTALRSTRESAVHDTALALVHDLAERVRANKGEALREGASNPYLLSLDARDADDPSPGAVVPCTGPQARCTTAQLGAWDRLGWSRELRAAMPTARAVVCFDDAPLAPRPGAGADAWRCNGLGQVLVVKLGWTPTDARAPAASTAGPRLVMQIVPGQAYPGFGGELPSP